TIDFGRSSAFPIVLICSNSLDKHFHSIASPRSPNPDPVICATPATNTRYFDQCAKNAYSQA
ncbi:MAG: hypothetical protein WBE12_07390, partial [Candidatus Acidiferrum sp.]